VTRADVLAAPVAGLGEALDVVARLDRSLVGGLRRPAPAQAAALVTLAESVSGTPLASRVTEAAEKAAAGAADEDHLTVIAAARTALLGAVHDGLLARVDEATGRTRADWIAPPADEAHAPHLRAAARSWLCDLARAGWQGIDHELIAGSAQVISAMLADLRLRRLATLLDGFAAELAASCPGAALERVPERRWADLWSRAMLLAHPGAQNGLATCARGGSGASSRRLGTATGRLLPLGIDLHEHATAVQAQVHAVLEPAGGGTARLVRASVSAPKPDTVVGMGAWQLLRPHLSLLAACGDGRSMDLADMPVTGEGDLLWNDQHARPGAPADAFATARATLAGAVTPAVAPLDRHPVRICEPVFLDGYTAKADDGVVTFTVAGQALPVDAGRLPSAGPLTPALVAASRSCIALLRWDAGAFTVQPLAVETRVRQRTVAVHAGAWAGGTTDTAGVKAEQAAAEAVTVLRERAGRLLRR
jgi:hypothetical protein